MEVEVVVPALQSGIGQPRGCLERQHNKAAPASDEGSYEGPAKRPAKLRHDAAVARFWGSFIRSSIRHTLCWSQCEVSTDAIELQPRLRTPVRLTPDALGEVRFRDYHAPPFVWFTTAEFRNPSGRRVGQLFVPCRPARFRECLEGLGWPETSG